MHSIREQYVTVCMYTEFHFKDFLLNVKSGLIVARRHNMRGRQKKTFRFVYYVRCIYFSKDRSKKKT